jgi:hypothetical protein
MPFHNPYIAPSRAKDAWFLVGLKNSFPNIIASGSTVLADRLPCNDSVAPGCKVFHVPRTDSSQAVEANLEDAAITLSDELREQVMVFQYQGKFHAVDHVSRLLLFNFS